MFASLSVYTIKIWKLHPVINLDFQLLLNLCVLCSAGPTTVLCGSCLSRVEAALQWALPACSHRPSRSCGLPGAEAQGSCPLSLCLHRGFS